MTIFIALTALYISVVVGVGGFLAEGRLLRPRVTQWVPAAGDLTSATLRLKAVNWNGDDDKGSGGK
jgi:hypothetical protein